LHKERQSEVQTITNFKQKSKTIKTHVFFITVKAYVSFPCALRHCGIFCNNHRNAILVNYYRSNSTTKLFFDVTSCCKQCRFCCDH